MGSVGNQNPWAPYDSYKDCSLGICSVYCPQWCFYVLPPPPPSDDDDESGPTFSPLIIAIIGILASAFLLVTYYTLITKYCTRRRSDDNTISNGGDVEANPPQDQCHVSGLDESVIKSIAVCKYRKGDAGFFEGRTECSVCLCEFEDGENLRLLPKCTHAFHLPCIDTWLKSHSNCPLCRANIIANSSPPPPTLDDTQTELVLVIDNDDEEGVVSTENNGDEEEEEEAQGVKHLRRSISLGTFFTQKRLLVSGQELQGDGSNSKCNGAIGRSISTGRLMFSRYDNGTNSTILL